MTIRIRLTAPVLLSLLCCGAAQAISVESMAERIFRNPVKSVEPEFWSFGTNDAGSHLLDKANEFCFTYNTLGLGSSSEQLECRNNLHDHFLEIFDRLSGTRKDGLESFFGRGMDETVRVAQKACNNVKGADSSSDIREFQYQVWWQCFNSVYSFVAQMPKSRYSYMHIGETNEKLRSLERRLADARSESSANASLAADLRAEIQSLRTELARAIATRQGTSTSTIGSSSGRTAGDCVKISMISPVRMTLSNSCAEPVVVELTRECFTLNAPGKRSANEVVSGSSSSEFALESKFGSFCGSIADHRTDRITAQQFR
jgi:hypothetical protein